MDHLYHSSYCMGMQQVNIYTSYIYVIQTDVICGILVPILFGHNAGVCGWVEWMCGSSIFTKNKKH